MQMNRRALAGLLVTPAFRAFGQACAPAAGPGTPFVPPGGAVVFRKAVAALNAAEVTRLRLAYQRLRNLTATNPADPRGWMAQANVHCAFCGGPGPEVHFTWTFLPWHRAYLYFHERILMKLLNDNSFRLPYWDWDATVSRRLPTAYRTAAANSLFDANRSTNASGGLVSMPPAFFTPNPMSAPNFASFGGTAVAAGGLENGPHGSVHVWTGGPGGADMGQFSTAARDPVFYAHHCNIDRLWAEWVRRNPVAHANPTDAAFLNRTFTFFDENSVLRRIRMGQVLNTAPLGFAYPPGAALSKSAPPVMLELSLNESSKALQLNDDIRTAIAAPVARTRTLVVEGAVMPTKSGLYNIFAGDPPAAGADQAAAPNYLGYVALILGEHAHERRSTLLLTPKKDFFDRAAATDGTPLTIAEAGSTAGTKLEYTNVYLSEE